MVVVQGEAVKKLKLGWLI